MANYYNPIGSARPMTNVRADDPIERERPERREPGDHAGGGGGDAGGGDGTDPEGPPWIPGEAGEPGGPAPAPEAPPRTMAPIGAGNPFLQPGSPGTGPYRTTAFFTNRYAGGAPMTSPRVGPGVAMMPSAAGRPPLDDELMQSLVNRFRTVR